MDLQRLRADMAGLEVCMENRIIYKYVDIDIYMYACIYIQRYINILILIYVCMHVYIYI